MTAPCHTPECASPATTERRVGHVRAKDGDTWEARWVPLCRGCASDHDQEVQIKGWAPMTTTTTRSTK